MWFLLTQASSHRHVLRPHPGSGQLLSSCSWSSRFSGTRPGRAGLSPPGLSEYTAGKGHHETGPGPAAAGQCGWHTPAGQPEMPDSEHFSGVGPTLCSELPQPSPLRLPSSLRPHNRKNDFQFHGWFQEILPELVPNRKLKGKAVKDYKWPNKTKKVTGTLFFLPGRSRLKEAATLPSQQMGDLDSNSATYSQAVLRGSGRAWGRSHSDIHRAEWKPLSQQRQESLRGQTGTGL